IRDATVTGVQTCALPIYVSGGAARLLRDGARRLFSRGRGRSASPLGNAGESNRVSGDHLGTHGLDGYLRSAHLLYRVLADLVCGAGGRRIIAAANAAGLPAPAGG